MVRFSDMLGGHESPEEQPQAEEKARAEEPAQPEEPPLPEQPPQLEHEAVEQSPEDVLERLTQYATSARAADQMPAPVPTAPPASLPSPSSVAPGEDAAALEPVADDLLPRPKGRKGRS
jgi:hypothetical protein